MNYPIKSIRITFAAGTTLETRACVAQDLSNDKSCIVEFKYNKIALAATPKTTVGVLIQRYEKKLKKAQDISLGDTYKAYRAAKKDERNRNREENAKKIILSGLVYDIVTAHHYRIFYGPRTIDFFPTSGKWKEGLGGPSGQGVDAMIKELRNG
jgi:hypothetical protein